MPQEFHEGCYCFRGDQVETARALGLPVRCAPGLPCACSGYPLLDDILELGKRPRVSSCACACAAMHLEELAAKQRKCCGGNCKCAPGGCHCPQHAVPSAFACVAEEEIREEGVMGLSLTNIGTERSSCCGGKETEVGAEDKGCCGGGGQSEVVVDSVQNGGCCGGQGEREEGVHGRLEQQRCAETDFETQPTVEQLPGESVYGGQLEQARDTHVAMYEAQDRATHVLKPQDGVPALPQGVAQSQALVQHAFAQTTYDATDAGLHNAEAANGYPLAAVDASTSIYEAGLDSGEVEEGEKGYEDGENGGGLILMQSPTRSGERTEGVPNCTTGVDRTEDEVSNVEVNGRSPRRSRGGDRNGTRKRSFACPQCPSTFFFKQNRDRHVNEVHLGRRPHKCDYPGCGGAFKNRSGLKQHQRTVHEKARPFKCELCDSAFGQRNHLTQHVLVVHNKVKMFECAECGMCFSNVGNRTQHIKRKHAGKV